jgi:hypothetical protein
MAIAIGAVGPVVLLALLFGNQWVYKQILESEVTRPDKAIGPLVSWLEFPYWRLTTQGHFLGFKYVFIQDITVLLFLVFVVALVVFGARVLDPARGAAGALILGWWGTLIAAGIAGLIRGLLTKMLMEDLYPRSMSTTMIWQSASQGLGFGFAYGWLAGVGALVAFTMTRSRGLGTQQRGGPMPAHPSATPYAPPSANPYGSPYGQPPAQPPAQPPGQQGWQQGPPQGPPQAPPPGAPPRPYDGGPPPPR